MSEFLGQCDACLRKDVMLRATVAYGMDTAACRSCRGEEEDDPLDEHEAFLADEADGVPCEFCDKPIDGQPYYTAFGEATCLACFDASDEGVAWRANTRSFKASFAGSR